MMENVNVYKVYLFILPLPSFRYVWECSRTRFWGETLKDSQGWVIEFQIRLVYDTKIIMLMLHVFRYSIRLFAQVSSLYLGRSLYRLLNNTQWTTKAYGWINNCWLMNVWRSYDLCKSFLSRDNQVKVYDGLTRNVIGSFEVFIEKQSIGIPSFW